METLELIKQITKGEDSKNQFKVTITNSGTLAAEMVAFSNALGGRIFLGVSDDGVIVGLTQAEIRSLNQRISNAASEKIKPAISPLTEIVSYEEKLILIISIPQGINKPYMDNKGIIWTKSAGDRRKAAGREEIQRMFQSAGLIHGDEVPVPRASIANIDFESFSSFFESMYSQDFDSSEIPLPRLLENMNLAKNSVFNVAGVLLFGKEPQFSLPSFIIKAVEVPSNDIIGDTYLDSRDITGNISNMFVSTLSFLMSKISYKQGERSMNSLGKSEIPRVVFEELLANAIIHRDYFIQSPIKIFVFSDRIEIISPGHLPNNLTIENIKAGNSNIRNPILASFATKLLPYRGLGSGIRRSLNAYEDIEFEDDRDGNKFKVIIKRQ